jgi:hypothetical protein
MKANKLSYSNLWKTTWMCVEKRCRGRDFLLMALQEGGMEEMLKKRGGGKIEGKGKNWG